MSLLPVDEALHLLLDKRSPSRTETIELHAAGGRVLAQVIYASHNQPPFDASAMDGYAIRSTDAQILPVSLRIIGESAAGARFDGVLQDGEAVRIFTGAPLPEGADTIVIQENTTSNGQLTTILEGVELGRHIRRAGLDFSTGECLLTKGTQLDAGSLSLAAASGHAQLTVYQKPVVAILATGDELVTPGSERGPDQIISSNSYGTAEIIRRNGGQAVDMGIVPDQMEKLEQAIHSAFASEADILVTLGGASVGDHDLVHKALTNCGVKLDFWKIAMRPGKPLMSGTLTRPDGRSMQVLGLPGNPASCLVCGYVFLAPLVATLAGQPNHATIIEAQLTSPMPENGNRRDYARVTLAQGADGIWQANLLPLQDSSMLTVIARADGLLIREPHVAAAQAGETCRVLLLKQSV